MMFREFKRVSDLVTENFDDAESKVLYELLETGSIDYDHEPDFSLKGIDDGKVVRILLEAIYRSGSTEAVVSALVVKQPGNVWKGHNATTVAKMVEEEKAMRYQQVRSKALHVLTPNDVKMLQGMIEYRKKQLDSINQNP